MDVVAEKPRSLDKYVKVAVPADFMIPRNRLAKRLLDGQIAFAQSGYIDFTGRRPATSAAQFRQPRRQATSAAQFRLLVTRHPLPEHRGKASSLPAYSEPDLYEPVCGVVSMPIQADIEVHCRMRQRANTDSVNAGKGNVANGFQVDAT